MREPPAEHADPSELPTRSGIPAQTPSRADSEALPQSIGAYRILGRLGEGGMGVVLEAEQQSPRRRVALKVIRDTGLLDEVHLKMFQREAETLARLKHANIGAIYESGRTEDGRHFFAMELVQGKTLDLFLRKREWGSTAKAAAEELRFRIGLFRKIADAVHYAHLRGVIHRDLKPSNIIVAEDDEGRRESGAAASDFLGLPEIKILDFGIARLTGAGAQVTTLTEVGVIKGTLPYMSPEQARGSSEAIDIRSDVYALGVVLYQMISGKLPYEVSRSSLIEAVRIICEDAPTPLSRTMEAARRLDPDIETIVGKALEKEVDRRYASAAALSEDLGRWLSSQPILARPPSAVYQIRKFAARNKVLVGGVVATILVLAAGVVATSILGLREAAARRGAVAARGQAERIGYVANIAAAEAGLRHFELAEVKRRLAACPPALRGWEWRHLEYRSEMSEQILRGHRGRIYSVAVNPEGTLYASASVDPDNTVRLWDAKTGASVAVLDSRSSPSEAGSGVRSVAFSRDGRHLAWSLDDGTIRISSVPEGREVRVLQGHEKRVNAIAFTPDGREIVSASFDQTVRRWDADTGASLAVLKGHEKPIWSLAICGDGKTIVSGDASGTIHVWERASGRSLRTLPFPGDVLGLACSPDGSRVAAAGLRGAVRIWGTDSGEPIEVSGSHEDVSTSPVFSPDGSLLATASKDRTIRLWDVASGKRLATLVGHDDAIMSVAFEPDGKKLVSGAWDRTLRVWSADPARASPVLVSESGPILAMAVSPQDASLVYATASSGIRFLDPLSGQERLRIPNGAFPLRGFELSADGSLLVAGYEDEVLKVWAIPKGGQPVPLRERKFERASSLDFLPGATEVLVGTDRDGKLTRWNVETDTLGREVVTPLPNLRDMAITRDGARLAAVGGNSTAGITLVLVELPGGKLLGQTPIPHLDPDARNGVGDLWFGPDGSVLATVHTQDYTLRLWDGRTLEPLAIGTGHTENVRSVTFSPDGSRIATCAADFSVRLWDSHTAEALGAMRTEDSYWNMGVEFSPDGKTLYSSGFSGKIFTWRTEP